MNVYRISAGILLFLAFSVLGVQARTGKVPQRLADVRGELEFLEDLVDTGLALAQEDDPLQRAQRCNVMAEQLSRELRRASKQRQSTRVVELGDLLQQVLVRGVADNLGAARFAAPLDSPRAKEVDSWGEKITKVARTVADDLDKEGEFEDDDNKEAMTKALQALSKGRKEIEKITQWKGPWPDWFEKGKGKGKGKKK